MTKISVTHCMKIIIIMNITKDLSKCRQIPTIYLAIYAPEGGRGADN